MKKLILSLGLVTAVSLAGFAQISGTGHDFSSQGWGTTEICLPCHTPHNSQTLINAPLWNHQVSVAVYTLYDNTISATMNAITGQPNGSSKLCLSCHDGTVALDNFGSVTNGTHFIPGVFNLGANLSNDHPISFTYDAALATADGGLFNPTVALSGLGGTITADLLIGGQMQCSSCHDVHSKYNLPSLLKIDNNASALCLTCHNK